MRQARMRNVRVNGGRADAAEDVGHVVALDADRDGHLQVQPLAVYVRLHLVSLRCTGSAPRSRERSGTRRRTHLQSQVKIRLRSHEDGRYVV